MAYVAEGARQFELPAISLAWWDTAKEQLWHVELPGMAVTVGGGVAAEVPAGAGETSWPRFWWGVLAAVLAPRLLLRRAIGRLWHGAARSRAESERHLFRLLRAAIRRGRPAPVMRELMRWLDRISDGQRPARLDRFLARYGDADGGVVLKSLQQELDKAGRIADRRALLNVLIRARGRWLEGTRQKKAGMFALPPLNFASNRED